MIFRTYLIFVFLLLMISSHAQDPWRFKSEIDAFTVQDEIVNYNDIIVFTGSSSIRLWPEIDNVFPDYNVINRGFGGSQMSDLNFFWDKLILQYSPLKVFIYEGANDISEGKSVQAIMDDTKVLANKIQKYLPATKIYFISPKPSMARWDLKEQYESLNFKMAMWALWEENISFIDVWTPMCDKDGIVLSNIFVDDNLHMNATGYDIWTDVIKPFVEE